jgi:hypothetical protein
MGRDVRFTADNGQTIARYARRNPFFPRLCYRPAVINFLMAPLIRNGHMSGYRCT